MLHRTYPGRLTRDQWLKLSRAQRNLLAARAMSDVLDLWRSCGKKTCRRAHTCHGDERCRIRPHLVDFNNPNFRRLDYVSTYKQPAHLRIPSAILDYLAHWRGLPAPEQILDECAAEASIEAASALRRAFRLERKRARPSRTRIK